MKCYTIHAISLGGERVEAGSEVALEPVEFLRLSKLGAVEPIEIHTARASAVSAAKKAQAEAEAKAASIIAEADAAARKAADAAANDAESKVDKSAGGSRARAARPVAAS